MKQKKRSLKSFASSDFNPFLVEAKAHIVKFDKKIHGTRMLLADSGTGEIISNIDGQPMTIGPEYEYKKSSKDIGEYRKIYVEALKPASNLTQPGLKLLYYILSELRPKKDYVYMNIQDALNWCGYKSHRPFYDGLVDLLENRFICQKASSEPIYWINPAKIFNGDRRAVLFD